MVERALLIFAHPDDEVLAAGGTIARLRDEGCLVNVLFTADGETSRFSSCEQSKIQNYLDERKKNCFNALSILGVDENCIHFLDYPDNKLDTVPLLDLSKKISHRLHEFQPDLVITHSGGDLNVDHRKTSEATMISTRPCSYPHEIVILEGEVNSSTEWRQHSQVMPFLPNYFIEISQYIEVKLEALSRYDNEIPDYPHARSLSAVEALARLRGCSIHASAAEAFYLHRAILK